MSKVNKPKDTKLKDTKPKDTKLKDTKLKDTKSNATSLKNEESSVKQSSAPQEASNEKLKALLESNDRLPNSLKEALIKQLEKGEQESTASTEREPILASVMKQIKQTPVQVIDKVSTKVNQTVETIRTDRIEQVKSEVRRWVEQVDLQAEAVKLLSQLSIELKTSIRLVPDSESKLGLKPDVSTKAQLKWGEDLDQQAGQQKTAQEDISEKAET